MAFGKEVEPLLIAFVKQNKLLFSTNTFKEVVSKVGARPLSVVSISHPNDGQRNQILNECLKYLQTYNVNKNSNNDYIWKSKSNSDTKGLFLWSEPFIVRKSCQEVAVLLIESNGCFDDKTATREDMMLFALNSVLSSTMIYSISENFSQNVLDFMQLFSKYGKGGIGSDLSDSFSNIVLLVRDWKDSIRYPFGYHDSATCPPNDNKQSNYKKDVLNVENDISHEIAFKNQYFLDSFQKISFCLMPGNDSQFIDQNSNIPKFIDIFGQITGRLFHPSSISIKRFGEHKFNGQLMAKLFEQISVLFAETDEHLDVNDLELKVRLKNVMALLNGINLYKYEFCNTIEDNEYLSPKDLQLLHNKTKNIALKLFESTKDMSQTGDQVLRDRFNNIFEEEMQKVWQLYQDLNQLKSQILDIKPRTQKMIDEMLELVVNKKKEFNGSKSGIDSEISQLIGFSLEGLTTTVRSVFNGV